MVDTSPMLFRWPVRAPPPSVTLAVALLYDDLLPLLPRAVGFANSVEPPRLDVVATGDRTPSDFKLLACSESKPAGAMDPGTVTAPVPLLLFPRPLPPFPPRVSLLRVGVAFALTDLPVASVAAATGRMHVTCLGFTALAWRAVAAMRRLRRTTAPNTTMVSRTAMTALARNSAPLDRGMPRIVAVAPLGHGVEHCGPPQSMPSSLPFLRIKRAGAREFEKERERVSE